MVIPLVDTAYGRIRSLDKFHLEVRKSCATPRHLVDLRDCRADARAAQEPSSAFGNVIALRQCFMVLDQSI
jgi:hypothetical protein